ncbi:MAG: hypothetical protein IT325_00555 [Anaerolineae bacterium]|nr:hypothetical protein [Anaerolineae bacterium]
MRVQNRSRRQYTEIAIFGISVAVTGALFLIFVSRFDLEDSALAFDWKMLWPGFRGGQLHWDEFIQNPPWSIIFVMPLGFLSLRASWGVMMLLTLFSLILSVPRQGSARRWYAGILALVLSYPALRELMDGNFEAFTILGVLLMVRSHERRAPVLMALGVLLAMIKPQITYLLLVIAALHTYRTTPRAFQVRLALALLVVIIPTSLWQGGPWLESYERITRSWGISLSVILGAAGVPSIFTALAQIAVVAVSLWAAGRGSTTLTPPKMGMLLAGGLLAAPYSQSLSMLVVLAIGVIPVMLDRPRVGIPLFALFNLPYLTRLVTLADPPTALMTASLVAAWLALLWLTVTDEARVFQRKAQPLAQTS